MAGATNFVTSRRPSAAPTSEIAPTRPPRRKTSTANAIASQSSAVPRWKSTNPYGAWEGSVGDRSSPETPPTDDVFDATRTLSPCDSRGTASSPGR
jgi:hypothetical protein